ncbi:PH domain-containing protein [Enterococcus hulanensis]|uniref:PH domain-containing protein n=1 Tax=Enterococcus hulanensis TaxID=2559929 RepID=UPI00288F5B5F|nr:PH domain-containing protein [Enterococcus hulanensis]MDT2659919.1 PH domain-containing protein [Enterococcus hulanensis]
MKTAEEMYQFCQDTGFFSGSDQQWGVRLFTVLEKHLVSDEEILVCFIGLHNRTSATKNDGFYAYALTNQRFIMGQKKMIGDDFKVIPLANMQDLRLIKETSLDLLEITSLEGTIKIVLTEEEAPKVLAKLKEAIQLVTKEKKTENQLSKAEQLLKMKELLDQGILNESEFAKIKDDILK